MPKCVAVPESIGKIKVRWRAGERQNITPEGMPEWGTVNVIEPSAHDPGRAFVVVHKYREDDFTPYIFRTNDYGKNWCLITVNNGIPSNHFVRVVREDPDRKGLLYAGTEFGMYISFDDGNSWQSFQLNLPVVQIADELSEKLTSVEQQLIQTEYEKGADMMINFPPQLDTRFFYVLGVVLGAEARPTDGSYESFEELEPKLAIHLDKLQEILDEDVVAFNEIIQEENIPPIMH